MTERRGRGGASGAALVAQLRLGPRQARGTMAVFPLLPEADGSPTYITLREALRDGRAQITEVSEGGAVPELRVTNKSDERILILDGEELIGAKQNRVLNTSILVGKSSTLVVPVSCTEAGRWSYAAPAFHDSDVVAERKIRHAMRASVSQALYDGGGHRSDQGRVWHEVDEMHLRQGTSSPSQAMHDAYVRKQRDLSDMLGAFPLVEGQCGLLVVHGRQAVGLDFVSRSGQYAQLHDKLLRSYVFEALVSDRGKAGGESVAAAFLERLADLPGERYKSPGLGWDVRFEGGGLLGSVLTYRDHAIHGAFFDIGAVDEADGPEGPAGPGGGRRAHRLETPWRIGDAHERARRRQAHPHAPRSGAPQSSARETDER